MYIRRVNCYHILIQYMHVQSDTEVSRSTSKYLDLCFFMQYLCINNLTINKNNDTNLFYKPFKFVVVHLI